MKRTNPHKQTHIPPAPAGAASIESLAAALRSEDGMVRENARTALVAIGNAATSSLMELLSDVHEQVRWEAAKALSEIRDPRAAERLVAALEDERSGTRWVAAEGLIALGHAGVLALLRMLATGRYSVRLREGAHHVLNQTSEEGFAQELAPVIAALEGFDPSTVVPPAALSALATLVKHSHKAR